MEIQHCPYAVDEPNLLYKLQRKLKVFNEYPLPNRGYNLITSASKFGLVFIASPDGTLSVYYLKDLVSQECAQPAHLSVQLLEKPTFVAVSYDHELLAVTGGQVLAIYKISDFQNENVAPSATIRCDVPSPALSSVQWNPCMSDVIALAYLDGTLMIATVSSNQIKKIRSKAICVCWSPKGKQLVVGNSDGTLCQYKPDLSPMKQIPLPNLFEGAPAEVLAIHWISTYQFAAVYRSLTETDKGFCVTIVNTPKGGKPTCMRYEDICYSMEFKRPLYYYLIGLAQWNMIIASSSNSMEIATLYSADSANWIQWCQYEEARPELPLSDKKRENFPVGLCIDTCAIHQLPWGENERLPHMPHLLVVSDLGMLTIFNMVYLGQASSQICSPPQQLILPARAMISAVPGEQSQPSVVQQPAQVPVAPVQQAPQIQVQQPPMVPAMSAALPTSAPRLITSVMKDQTKPAPPVQVPIATPVVPPQVSQPNVELPKVSASELKAEQERAAIKVNKELTSMLIKEVNEFQMELHEFTQQAIKIQTQAIKNLCSMEISTDLQAVDAKVLSQDCSVDEIRLAIVQLKMELVRACAVVAEARTHTEAKDLQIWGQPDPLSTKSLASIKQLSYYLESQLLQAHKTLDYKWVQVSRNSNYDNRQPGMIRPILDDVYQPLVKQQEIISRQQAVLKTLRATLNQCDTLPSWKSSPLLRRTPLQNKDPLSKLTKNILNMSIEPQKPNMNRTALTEQKLEALKDMLANHKTVRIKPVNIEMTQQFAALRLSYEKKLKEKVAKELLKIQKSEKKDPIVKEVVVKHAPKPQVPVKTEPPSKIEVKREVTFNATPAFAPMLQKPVVSGLASVTRTLFTDEVTESRPKPIVKPVPDIVQIKPLSVDLTNNSNTFMGQKICTPSKFAETGRISTDLRLLQPNSKPSEAKEVLYDGDNETILAAETKVHNNFMKDMKPPDKVVLFEVSQTPSTIDNKNDARVTIQTATTKTISSAASMPSFNLSKSSESSTVLATVSSPSASALFASANVASGLTITPITLAEGYKSSPIQTTPISSPLASSIFASANASSSGGTSPTSIFSTRGSIFASPSSPTSMGSIFGTGTATTKTTSIFGTSITPSVSITASSVPTGVIASSPTPVENQKYSSNDIITHSQEAVPAATHSLDNVSISLTQLSGSSFTTSSTPLFKTSSENSQVVSTSTPVPTGTSKPILPSAVSPAPSGTSQPLVLTTPSPTFIKSNEPSTTSPVTTEPNSSPISTTVAVSTKSNLFGLSLVTSSMFTLPTFSNAQTSVFGGTATTPPPSSFGTPPPSPQKSLFITPSHSPQSSPVTTPQNSAFFTPAVSTQSSIFASKSSSPSSIFGAAIADKSVFGTPVAASQQSLFGTPSTTQSSSIFGGAESNMFAAASISTTNSSQNNPTNIFSGGNTSSGGNVFGGSFNQSSSAAAIFGAAAGTPIRNQATNFWGGATNTSPAFGSTFVPSTQSTSIFGGGGGSFSSNASSGQPFGSPVNQGSVFGSADAQPATSSSVFGAPAYGSSSVFGEKPAFGQSAGFGSSTPGFGAFSNANKSPSSGFGGAALFGSTSSYGSGGAFGSTSPGSFGAPASGFGQSNQSNATFESMATQNTVTFGNLAQQSGQQSPPKPAFNTSPSFTGWRG